MYGRALRGMEGVLGFEDMEIYIKLTLATMENIGYRHMKTKRVYSGSRNVPNSPNRYSDYYS
jgi:hypothetical protein